MVCITEGGEPPLHPRCLQNVGVTFTRLESREMEVFPTGPQHHYRPRGRATSDVHSSAHLNVRHCSQLSVRVSKCQRKPGLERRRGPGRREGLGVLERDATARRVGMGPEDIG